MRLSREEKTASLCGAHHLSLRDILSSGGRGSGQWDQNSRGLWQTLAIFSVARDRQPPGAEGKGCTIRRMVGEGG